MSLAKDLLTGTVITNESITLIRKAALVQPGEE